MVSSAATAPSFLGGPRSSSRDGRGRPAEELGGGDLHTAGSGVAALGGVRGACCRAGAEDDRAARSSSAPARQHAPRTPPKSRRRRSRPCGGRLPPAPRPRRPRRRGFDERGPPKKDGAVAADDDHLVGEGRDVGPTGGAGAGDWCGGAAFFFCVFFLLGGGGGGGEEGVFFFLERRRKKILPNRSRRSSLSQPSQKTRSNNNGNGKNRTLEAGAEEFYLTQCHLRDPVSRHPRLVEENPPKVVPVGEDVGLSRQVRPTGINDVETGVDSECRGDLLEPEVFLDGYRVVGASFHGGVVGSDGNELAGDAAEARDDAAAGDGLGSCFFVVSERGRGRGSKRF